ncbi:MAG: superoxide dismutase [Bacteroidia bacterium]
MAEQLPPLPYKPDEYKFVGAETMTTHHDKHHQAYVDNYNKAVQGSADENKKLIDVLKEVSGKSPAIRNNGGGHFNHTLFWEILKPGGSGSPSGEVADAIKSSFGSFDDFKTKFKEQATGRFGSGWAWLIVSDRSGKLELTSTANQDAPIMDVAEKKGIPILGLDVWEHAYYLDFKNLRPNYVDAFWGVVDWDAVNNKYQEAKKNFYL